MEHSKEDVKSHINATLFRINMISVYDTESGRKLVAEINSLLSGGDESIQMATLGQRVTAFIEITTWFQFKELMGDALTKYYVSTIGSSDMSPKEVKRFLEHTARQIYLEHIREDADTFIRDIAPFAIMKVMISVSTMKKESKYTRKQLAIDTIDYIRSILTAYRFFRIEPVPILDFRCKSIQERLFDKRNTNSALDPEVIKSIKHILTENLSETDTNVLRMIIG